MWHRIIVNGLLVMFSASLLFGQDAAVRISEFTPQGLGKDVRQVRVRFSEQMVPFGQVGQAAPPFEIDCPVEGQGRWLDGVSWVYDFERPLPSGLQCQFALRSDIESLAGRQVARPATYRFSTGGPNVLRTEPYDGHRDIAEDQVFILYIDGPVSEKSLLEHSYMVVGGLASRVDLRIVKGELRESILKTQYRSGDEDGENIVLLQAHQIFPPRAQVRLVWGRGIESPEGVVNQNPQTFNYRVRPRFRAEVTCRRQNPDSGCIPLTPIRVNFSAPVSGRLAGQLRLREPDGTLRPPEPIDQEYVTSVAFKAPFTPRTRFQVQVPSDLEDDAGRPLENLARFPVAIYVDDYPPLATFAASFGIIEAEETPVLPVTVRNLEAELDLGAFQVDSPPVMSGKIRRIEPETSQHILEWLRRVQERGWDERNRSIFDLMIARGEDFEIPKPNGPSAFEVVGIPLPGPGFFVVELRSELLGRALLQPAEPMYVSAAALVTNLAVHLKWGIDSSLIWVTTLDSARPVEAAEVEVRDCEGKLLWEGTTNGQGLVSTEGLPAPGETPVCAWNRLQRGLFVTARKGEDFSFVHSDWNEGIESWRFGIPREWDESLTAAHTVLDRPLFRAGETVHMKHVFRRRLSEGLQFFPPGELPGKAVVSHQGSREEYEIALEWSDIGTAESSWEIPSSARLGNYLINLRDEGGKSRVSGSFRVEEFRVPLMKGILNPPSGDLVRPDAVKLGLGAEYLAGGRAAHLPIRFRYRVEKRAAPGFEDFDNFDFFSGAVQTGVFRGPERDSSEPQETFQTRDLVLDQEGWHSLTLTELPEITENSVLVAEMEFRDPNGEVQTVGSRIPLWASGRLVGIRPEDRMPKREAVAFEVTVTDLSGDPVAGAPVRVQLYERKNFAHRKRLIGGFYAYENVREVRRLDALCEGTTDEKGTLSCRLESPVSGNLILEASTADESGYRSVSQTSIWAAGEEDFWFSADDHDRIDLLPDKKQYLPGESARFQVRMPFREATALVTVEREGVVDAFVRELSGENPVLEVPLRGAYAPNVFVSALLVRGRVSDVAPTAIVDLAKPAYKLGLAEIRVGWENYALEVGVETDRETYQVRDTVEVALDVAAVRGEFSEEDTEIMVAVVDEGLLELLPNESWDVLEAFMGRRRHGVETSTAQMQVVGKRHFGLKALPAGGGGGKQSTRELFDTLVYWNGRVKPGPDGKAAVSFQLNDSITGFRIAAVAVSGADRFGTGYASIRTTQDLILFSGIAPVVREGDRIQSEFTLRNTTDRELEIDLKADVTGLPSELQKKTITLAPNDSEVVGWELEVPAGVSQLDYRLEASGEGLSDALAVSQRVVPAVPVRVIQGTIAQLDPDFTTQVLQPANAVDGRGGIEISLNESLAAGMNPVRDYLRSYPYTCLEQRLSRAVVLDDRQEWDLWMGVLPSYLDDAGFASYFASSRSGDEILTSYILALSHARGWDIPEESRNRMLEALQLFASGQIENRSPLAAADLTLRKLAAIEALARYERVEPFLLTSLTIAPEIWPTSAVIDWFSVLLRVPGIPRRQQRLEEAEQVLKSRLDVRGSAIRFVNEDRDRLWWLMTSADQNLVRLMLLLMESGRGAEDLPRMMVGALNRMSGGHWDLTTANAWGSLAVREFTRRYESVPVSGRTEARLEGREVSFDWGNAPSAELELEWPTRAGELEVLHTGAGRPWLSLSAAAAVRLSEPVSNGFTVRKEIEAVERRSPDVWSVGDVLRVRLTLEGRAHLTWVVLTDPIPAGAVILGSGLGGDSSLLTEGEEDRGWVWPTHQERSFEAMRVYYRYVPRSEWQLEYTIRLNSAGEFNIPPTRIEAMYLPELHAEFPNPKLEVLP